MIICGRCGAENPQENKICSVCGQDLYDVEKGSPNGNNDSVLMRDRKTGKLSFRLKDNIEASEKNPFDEDIKCSKYFGVLSLIFAHLSMFSMLLIVFIDIWSAVISLILSMAALVFSKMQERRCYEQLMRIGRVMAIVCLCITLVAILVYVLFASILNLLK